MTSKYYNLAKTTFILRTAFVIIVFIAMWMLITFEFNDIPDPLNRSKQLLSWIIIAIGLLGSGLTWVITPRKKTVFISWVDGAVFVYIIYGLANYYCKHNSFDIPITLVLWLIYLTIRIFYICIGRKLPVLCVASILCYGLLIEIYGFLQLYGFAVSNNLNFKSTGPFDNPGPFAIFLICLMPLAIAVYRLKGKHYWIIRTIAFLFLIGLFLLIPALDSRTSLIIAVFIAFSLFYVFKAAYFKRYYKMALPALVLILPVIGYLLFLYKSGSSNGRLLIYKITFHAIDEAKIFGHGVGSYPALFGRYQIAYYRSGTASLTDIRHADKVIYAYNDYLQIVFESGLIGLLLYSLIIFTLFRSFNWQRSLNRLRLGLGLELGMVLSAAAIWISALFAYPLEQIEHSLLLISVIACLGSINNKGYMIKVSITVIYAYLVVGVVFFTVSVRQGYQSLVSYRSLANAINEYNQKDYKSACRSFEGLKLTLIHDELYLSSFGKALFEEGLYKESLSLLFQAQQLTVDEFVFLTIADDYLALRKISEAEKYYKRAEQFLPNRLFPKFKLLNFYIKLNRTNEAKNYALQILAAPIINQSDAVKEIRAKADQYLQLIN